MDSDTTELNALGLEVPADGTLGLAPAGSRLWSPEGYRKPGEPERRVELDYLPVRTADGKLIDVVAWRPDNPAQWWLRTGNGLILGASELERVSWTALPCYLVATPAAWRRADRARTCAICLLDWEAVDTPSLFGTVWGTIIAESRELADRLAARQHELAGPQLLIEVDRLA